MSSEGYLVDIFKILRFLYSKKKSILITTCISFVMGVIIALTSRTEYTIEIQAIPITGNTKGGLSGIIPSTLSALGANINLSNIDNPTDIAVNVYPVLFNSRPFKMAILNSNIRFEKPDTVLPLSIYLEKYQPFSLPSAFFTSVKKIPNIFSLMSSDKQKNVVSNNIDSNILVFDKKIEDLFFELDSRIKIKVDQLNNNLITLTIKLPDKIGVAELGKKIVTMLNDAIINYKIQKAKTDAEFIEGRYKEAYSKFVKAQMNLSTFRDQNKSIISASAKAIEERLIMEFNIAYNVYNSLAMQLEQAQLKIQENKPVLQIIEPAYVPNYKSGPKRILIVTLTTLFGLFVSVVYVYCKNNLYFKIS
ncbi:MAG: hypothetical protein N2662_08200 [Bacteroidales bacterium]|nr:hypothetical protein [Bacteroidales bacterium]